MPRVHRRPTGTEADQVSAGRRHLAAIDPAVMRRIIGRPEQRDAGDAANPASTRVPAHRRSY
jgi:hypothetical protein